MSSSIAESLEASRPKSLPQLIGCVRNSIAAADRAADDERDRVIGDRAASQYRFGGGGFTLPPGAAHCAQSFHMRYGPIDFVSSGSCFTSFVSHHALVTGRYMYEVTLYSAGSLQIGFCAPMHVFLWDAKKGVGDFPFTVAYNGGRGMVLNVTGRDAGWRWVRGDIISCLFDLDAGEVRFLQNGILAAQTTLPTVGACRRHGTSHSDYDVELCYFPALSLDAGEKCEINLGGRPFVYPQAGYMPVDVDGYQPWIDRLHAATTLPAHLHPYRSVVESLLFERVLADPRANFMECSSAATLYIIELVAAGRLPCAKDLLATIRRTFPADIFTGALTMICSICASYSIPQDYAQFFVPLATQLPPPGARHRPKTRDTSANVYLRVLELVLDVPDAIPAWLSSRTVHYDLLSFLHQKTPNDRDLAAMYPDVMLADSDAARHALEEQQLRVAQERVTLDDQCRYRITDKLLEHPAMRASYTSLIGTLVAELKDRNPQRLVTYKTYDGSVGCRLFFSTVSAVVRRTAGLDDKAVAEFLCPLSLIKLRPDNAPFAGRSYEHLQRGSQRVDLSGVPDLGSHSPEFLVYLACQLFAISVKEDVMKAFNTVIQCNMLRGRLRAAERAGESPAKLAHLRHQFAQSSRVLSWNMSNLFLSGMHVMLMEFCSRLTRMVRYYATTPYIHYIPTVFADTLTDLLHFCRKTSPQYAEHMTTHPEVPLFFVDHFRSPVIQFATTREYLIMTVGALFDNDEGHRRAVVSVLAQHPDRMTRFFGELFDQLANPMAWTLVVNVMYRLNTGNTFCGEEEEGSEVIRAFHAKVPIPPERSSAFRTFTTLFVNYLNHLNEPDSSGRKRTTLEGGDCESFFRNIVQHCNWCITELSTALASADPSQTVSREVLDERRRTTSIFDYTKKMLHIVEFIVGSYFGPFFVDPSTSMPNSPTARDESFDNTRIAPTTKVSMVVELVAQALGRFGAAGSHLVRIAAAAPPGLERLTQLKILAPLVGIMIAFSGRKSPTIPEEQRSPALNPFAARMCDRRAEWPKALALAALDHDWPAVCASAGSNPRCLDALPEVRRFYSTIALPEPEPVRAHGNSDSDDESLCAICYAGPVERYFEPCGHASCASCLARRLVTDARCFFCKADIVTTRGVDDVPTATHAAEGL